MCTIAFRGGPRRGPSENASQYNNSWMGLLHPDKLTHKMTTQDDVNVRQRFAPLCFAASLSAPVLCPYTYGPYRARCFASQCIIS